MRDNEKEDARKRGGGRINELGAHSRYQFFRCGKIGGGGRINDGGRSGGTLRYMYIYIFNCTMCTCICESIRTCNVLKYMYSVPLCSLLFAHGEDRFTIAHTVPSMHNKALPPKNNMKQPILGKVAFAMFPIYTCTIQRFIQGRGKTWDIPQEFSQPVIHTHVCTCNSNYEI